MADLTYEGFVTGSGHYQPKRKNQWYMELPGETGIASIAIKTTKLPGGSFKETVLDYINQKYYFAGKWEWKTIDIKLQDYIGDSTANLLYNWFLSVYNPVTGKQAYGANMKKTVNIVLLDPEGEDLERWVLKGCWPTTFEWGELDYATDDLRELSMTLRYDRPELEAIDPNPTPEDI
jgi:hypothetical protein